MILKKSLLFTIILFLLSFQKNEVFSYSSEEEKEKTTITEDLKEGSQKTAEGIKKAAKKVKEKAREGGRIAKAKSIEAAEYVSDKVQEGTKKTKRKIDQAEEKTLIKTRSGKTQAIANWHKVKGKIREVWGRLTDKDVERIEGKSEALYGVLQERYGYTRAEAEEAYKEARANLEN